MPHCLWVLLFFLIYKMDINSCLTVSWKAEARPCLGRTEHWGALDPCRISFPSPMTKGSSGTWEAQHTLTSGWGTGVKCRQRICIGRSEAGLSSFWKEFRAALPPLRTAVSRKRWAGVCGALGVASWLWASIRPGRNKIQSWKDTSTFPLPRSHWRLHDPTVSHQN